MGTLNLGLIYSHNHNDACSFIVFWSMNALVPVICSSDIPSWRPTLMRVKFEVDGLYVFPPYHNNVCYDYDYVYDYDHDRYAASGNQALLFRCFLNDGPKYLQTFLR